MRKVFIEMWQWAGDRLLGAAGRASRFEDGPEAGRIVVPGQGIRRPFEVIDGGRVPGRVEVHVRPGRPVGPFRPTRRAG